MHARRGFVLLFGTKPVVTTEPGQPLRTTCPHCRQEADFLPRSYRNWFTLFFLPMFPIGGKRPISQCERCGMQFPVALNDLRAELTESQGRQSQQAIAMFNSLHKSPANSVTLNDLMSLYASLDEYDQAIAAAGQFPQALHASEQCMTTLGRVYLAKSEHATALQWFDAALGLNDAHADAWYFKAVTLMRQPSPDLTGATTAARAARTHGHPQADRLLEEIHQAPGK